MPTYDYACRACGHRFERFESIHDDASKSCLKCGKKKARRMLGVGAGLIFKGSGFYTTDYARKGKGGSEDAGSKDSEKKPEKKGPEENKPAAREEKKEKKEEKEPKK